MARYETFAHVGGESRQVVMGREQIATSTECVYDFVGPDLREQETKNKKTRNKKQKKNRQRGRLLSKKQNKIGD